MSPVFDWLLGISLTLTVEVITAFSFLPAYLRPWRRWKGIKWQEERPFVYPPIWFNGAMWFLMGLPDALGAWFVIRLNSSSVFYHLSLAFWIASLIMFGFWGIPWTFQTPIWSVIIIGLAGILSATGGILSWFIEPSRSIPGSVLLCTYAAILILFSLFHLFVWANRYGNPAYDHLVLHKRVENPIVRYFAEFGWPPLNNK